MDLSRLDFNGRDATGFLQAQLATDLRPLAEARWRWAALLSLKGRLLALGPLARLSTEHWRWLLPSDLVEAVDGHLRRYLLRSKLSIEHAPQPVTVAVATAPVAAEAPHAVAVDPAGPSHWQGWAPGYTLLLDPSAAAIDPQAEIRAQLARLRAGRPLISAASSDRHLPASLGLLEEGSVSVRKGCYPGQEIVARTHFLGRNKRVRCLLQGGLPVPATGHDVHAADRIVGEVVEACIDGDRYLALAVVEEAALEQPLQVDGRAVACAGLGAEG